MIYLGIDSKHLSEYLERVKNFIAKQPKMNEPNTKMKVIQPLFELIGWNFRSENVEAEHPVYVGSTIARVDYALKINNKPVALIEAKGFDSELDEKFIKQAYSYATISKIKWFILTNGKELHLYNSEWGDNFDKSLVFKGKVNDFPELISELSMLSPNSLKENIIEKEANKLWYKRNVREFFEKNPDKIAKKFASWVQKEIEGWSKKDVEIAISELLKEMKEEEKREGEKVETKILEEGIDKEKPPQPPYQIDFYFKNKEKSKELFDKLKLRISELGDDVKFYCTARNYISLRVLGKEKNPPTVVCFYPRKSFLSMDIKLNYGDVPEERDFIKDNSEICWWWKRGCVSVKLQNDEDIDYVFSLIKKAYEREKYAQKSLIKGV